MKITKEICDRLLLANTNNRPQSQHRIEALSRAMKSGWFVPNNGQTIVITESWNRLLDGQHRLYAIRESGQYIFDIPIVTVPDDKADDVFNTIDIVRGSRTSAQVIGLTTDIPNNRIVSSIITCLLKITKGIQSPSPSEILFYYDRYRSTILNMKVYTVCSVGKIKLRSAIWAGVLNAIIISGKECETISRLHRILENKCETVCDNLLLNMIVAGMGERGSCALTEFVKTTKAFLNPDLKCLKIMENEDISQYKAKNV